MSATPQNAPKKQTPFMCLLNNSFYQVLLYLTRIYSYFHMNKAQML